MAAILGVKMTMEDQALLREFAEAGSEPAFCQLVERHVNLVYSTARRRLGDVHRAQDVAQQVFVLLARKASRLPARVMLAGWLYRTTCHVASELRRREARHQHRVQQAAAAMNTESSDDAWHEIEPRLDEAMALLSETDRDAVVLRFFENKSLREVGAALGVSDDAAQKRLSRAVERLRSLLSPRDRPLTGSALVAALAAGAIQSAPTGLATTLAAGALSHALLIPSTSIALMSWTSLKPVIAATTILAAGTALVVQTTRLNALRQANTELQTRAQQAERTAETARDEAARAARAADNDPRTTELARLRAELTALRRTQSEAAAENARLREAMAQVNRDLQSQPARSETPGDPAPEAMQTLGRARLNYGRHWALACILFAEEHGGRMPATLAEAASFFGDPETSDMPDTVVDPRTQTFVVSTRNAGVTNLTLLRPDQFEITYHGALEQAPDPARTIIIREKEPFPALGQGGLMRTYIFADGHTEIYRAPEGNFAAWERERGLTATP